MMPPNADMRVARERALVGLERRARRPRAARVVVLDDRARRDARTRRPAAGAASRSSTLLNDSSLPCELADHREHVHARADLRVVGGALVRVLAVRRGR